MIAPNIIILFDGLNANIPVGFSRDTRFDGLFPKGALTGLGDNGGFTTHTHTSSNHTHAMGSHTHNGTTSTANGNNDKVDNQNSPVARHGHTHSYTSGAVSGGDTTPSAPVSDAVSNDPPYYDFIFIKSLAFNLIPDKACLLSSIVQPDLSYHSASEGRFLRGSNTSGDAGTIGGSSTNTHTWDHTHGVTSHSHLSVQSNAPSSVVSENNAAGGNESRADHTHALSFGSATQAIGTFIDSEVHSETIEPSHTKIRVYKNNTGNNIVVKAGLIALLIDGDNPIGWVDCDGTDGTPNLEDYFIKNTDATGVTTDGSNTHTHASFGHIHPVSGSHSHSVTVSVSSSNINGIGSGTNVSDRNHTHAPSTTSSLSEAYASDNIVPNESTSNEPEYIKAKFIMATKSALGGGASVIKHLMS